MHVCIAVAVTHDVRHSSMPMSKNVFGLFFKVIRDFVTT